MIEFGIISAFIVGRWRNRYAEDGFHALEKTFRVVETMQVKAVVVNYV